MDKKTQNILQDCLMDLLTLRDEYKERATPQASSLSLYKRAVNFTKTELLLERRKNVNIAINTIQQEISNAKPQQKDPDLNTVLTALSTLEKYNQGTPNQSERIKTLTENHKDKINSLTDPLKSTRSHVFKS